MWPNKTRKLTKSQGREKIEALLFFDRCPSVHRCLFWSEIKCSDRRLNSKRENFVFIIIQKNYNVTISVSATQAGFLFFHKFIEHFQPLVRLIMNQILIESSKSVGSGPNWFQIGNKMCYIPKISKFYIEKEYLF